MATDPTWCARFGIPWPNHGWIVARDYPLLKTAMWEFFKWLPPQLKLSWKETQKELHLPGGSLIEFKSASDPDSLRAGNIHWFWLDEPALLKRESYINLEARARRLGGIGWMTGTPKGMNWLHDDVYQAALQGDPEFAVIHYTTKYAGITPEKEIEKARSRYSREYFLQEYEARFQTFSGRVYGDFLEESHTDFLEYNPNWPLYCCFDFGFTNPYVCLWVQIDPMDRVHIIDEYYETGRTSKENAEAVAAYHKERGYGRITDAFADPEGPGERKDLALVGIPTKAKPHEVTDGLEQVRRVLKVRDDGSPGLLVDRRRCRNTIMEFNSYRYPEGRDKTNPAEKPIKKFDHSMDALRHLVVNLLAVERVTKQTARVLSGVRFY